LIVAALAAALLVEVLTPLVFGQAARARRVAAQRPVAQSAKKVTAKKTAAQKTAAAKTAAKTPARATRQRTVERIGPPQLSEARQRLAELGYWVAPAAAKKGHDDSFRHALMAFQKVEGLKPTGRLAVADLKKLRVAERPRPRFTGGPRVEVDLLRQVLFLVNEGGEVERVLPVSSGNGKPFEAEGWERDAITPIGRYFIQRKVEGWRKSALGELYYPNYILGGIAIHGSPSVPAYPDSHGCIRIPMYAAEEFSRITPVGLEVLVYDSDPPSPPPVARSAESEQRR
jgi:lipoprotein-anchoring transpeptidase ErfK/SrfK